ncbi:MAG: SET domain-containing protein [Allosphingosinicella sp.]
MNAMMMVETELRPSGIQGIGIFLLEAVREGQLIWKFDSRVDRVYTEAELASLPAATSRFLKRFSTWHEPTRLWVLCGDNGRHFNHSDAPNTRSQGIAFGEDVAAADLAAGTELTSDYRTICDRMRLQGLDF